MIFKEPRAKAPDYVKGSLSIKVEEFIPFLQEHAKNGWVNINLKEAKSGKFYAELDTWVPNKDRSESAEEAPPGGDIPSEDIPY